MAIPRVASGDQHPVNPALQGLQDEKGIDSAGAGDPDHADIRRILNPRCSCEIRPCIGTPVAEERQYLWLPVIVHFPDHVFCLFKYQLKSQIPISKSQINPKFQFPNDPNLKIRIFGFRSLEIVCDLGFGAWNLVMILPWPTEQSEKRSLRL